MHIIRLFEVLSQFMLEIQRILMEMNVPVTSDHENTGSISSSSLLEQVSESYPSTLTTTTQDGMQVSSVMETMDKQE